MGFLPTRSTALTALALTLSTAPAALAESRMVYLGGGGDPPGPGTIFDRSLDNIGKFVQSSTWNSEVRFNGGHPETEAILKNRFGTDPSKTGPFTGLAFDTLLTKYEQQLRSGAIKPGDQLMIVIDSHGGERPSGAKTHSIATGSAAALDKNNLGGGDSVSLDRLEKIRELARQKNVKLAILDFSCHSGNTLALADDSTCVISSTSPIHYGYNTFSNYFGSNMKAGRNLEEVFLKTRQQENLPSLPMISSPAGRKAAAEINERIAPFLYYADKDHMADKLSRYLMDAAEPGGCARENGFSSLLDQIDQLNGAGAPGAPAEFAALKSALYEYKQKQDEILKTLQSWGVPLLKKKEKFKSSVPWGKGQKATFELNFEWEYLIQTNPDSTISYIKERLAKEKNKEERAHDQAAIDCWEKLKAKKNEILAQYPGLGSVQGNFKSLIEKQKDTWRLAANVSREERKFYQALYSRYSAEGAKPDKGGEKNACKDFIL